ncbi:hypothetical protein BJY21_003088 [Kineosphaera limosa]|uniref:Uncharacterized protein n=1 Tax=Kineosphaera limosa NBRC 100340 TaxID=1184609 RepID=K6WAA1_9MICO|nr:hypothetical protein [Kineosphaera limosa]NYE01904.1 hypothetical protein [Kineosphaera limosa]GAB96130.1 hypothetical protein KILIM_032_00150 [Kineosphaera limosa NBRC 100340]
MGTPPTSMEDLPERPPDTARQPLVTERFVLLAIAALIIGGVMGWLSFMAMNSIYLALITALASAGTTLAQLDRIF